MATAHGGEIIKNIAGTHSSGIKQLGSYKTVESKWTRNPSLSPSFHINPSPKFHVANIQNILTKGELGKGGMFVKEIEKIKFLRDMCKEEKPYFLAFAETCLKDNMKGAEYEIDGYSYVASHRKDRGGGGVIIYIDEDASYKSLISVSDEMCSVVAIYLEELNLIVFMVYRPPPEQ